MTRERLAALSFEALCKLAKRVGIPLPAELNHDNLVEAILEEEEESRNERESSNNNPIRVEEKKYDLLLEDDWEPFDQEEEIELPERYNDTRIVLMLRDPAWAYTYWDIKDSELEDIKQYHKINGLIIRVNQCRGLDTSAIVVDSFDIPIKTTDNRWYINLPERDTYYYLDLVCVFNENEKVLARSNIVHVPQGKIVNDKVNSYIENKILSMSGIENMGVSAFGNRIPQRILSFLDEQ